MFIADNDKRADEKNRRCMSCENCDLITNTCLVDGRKCYENGVSLYPDCEKYEKGHWSADTIYPEDYEGEE